MVVCFSGHLLAVLCSWCIHRSVNCPSLLPASWRESAEGADRHIDEPWEVAEIQRNSGDLRRQRSLCGRVRGLVL